LNLLFPLPAADAWREALPAVGGTYVLWLRLEAAREIAFGRLGRFALPAGDYLYVGSARGPGGLRARLGRHLQGSGPAHWHVDYLRAAAGPQGAGWSTAPGQLECAWARALLAHGNFQVPVPGAGASDCRCAAHLVAGHVEAATWPLLLARLPAAAAGPPNHL
jgi:Uri superfamily endonuclease